MQSKVPTSPSLCCSHIHHSIPQWDTGNGLTFLRSTNQSDSRCFSLGTFMACHKTGLWGITAPSNLAKWAIFPISGAAVRQARAVNSRVNLWPWLLGQPSAVANPTGGSGESHPVAKVKRPKWRDEMAFSRCLYLSVLIPVEGTTEGGYICHMWYEAQFQLTHDWPASWSSSYQAAVCHWALRGSFAPKTRVYTVEASREQNEWIKQPISRCILKTRPTQPDWAKDAVYVCNHWLFRMTWVMSWCFRILTSGKSKFIKLSINQDSTS